MTSLPPHYDVTTPTLPPHYLTPPFFLSYSTPILLSHIYTIISSSTINPAPLSTPHPYQPRTPINPAHLSTPQPYQPCNPINPATLSTPQPYQPRTPINPATLSTPHPYQPLNRWPGNSGDCPAPRAVGGLYTRTSPARLDGLRWGSGDRALRWGSGDGAERECVCATYRYAGVGYGGYAGVGGIRGTICWGCCKVSPGLEFGAEFRVRSSRG